LSQPALLESVHRRLDLGKDALGVSRAHEKPAPRQQLLVVARPQAWDLDDDRCRGHHSLEGSEQRSVRLMRQRKTVQNDIGFLREGARAVRDERTPALGEPFGAVTDGHIEAGVLQESSRSPLPRTVGVFD
jgi:hypothetical protein